MARKKQRVLQHIMEDKSYDIIKRHIPSHWVIREFNRPDYGIDLVIELFEKIDDRTSETLGEYIYVQVKSVQSLKVSTEKAYPVYNVAKLPWKEDRSEYVEIPVVKYSFDTNSIYTIQTLGASVSVLLFLVDISLEEVYFISINDYIDRIILPKLPNYVNQGSYTLKIPTINCLSNIEISDCALNFYGKRAKLLSAFSKFNYQRHELEFKINLKDTDFCSLVEQTLYFIGQIENFDIWRYGGWAILSETLLEIQNLKSILQKKDLKNGSDIAQILIMWQRLTNIGNIYEDLCREWFLPKFAGAISSYPNYPQIIKAK